MFESRVKRLGIAPIAVFLPLVAISATEQAVERAPAPGGMRSGSASGTAPTNLDLTSLEQRLADTSALGVFTKLSLKNRIDDLLAQFRSFYGGRSSLTLADLRQKYEVLLLEVVSLLQNDDPALASTVSSSREAIWSILTDPKKLAEL